MANLRGCSMGAVAAPMVPVAHKAAACRTGPIHRFLAAPSELSSLLLQPPTFPMPFCPLE